MDPTLPQTSLAFDRLTRGYGRLMVVREASGAVAAGQVLLITGTNGSGKSTLLRCLAGLMAPQAGTIACTVAGRRLDVAARRRAIGYVAPDLGLYPELTCIENLTFFGRLRGLPPARGAALLDRLGLPPKRLAGALSSGMLQRLRWAWALLHRPPILLLDEPLQNLDAPGRRDVLELFEQHLERGLAVVASPDSLELPRVASRLELGR
ncbi:MAG: ABC transporter ATP-binding protein [Acidobacteria bacterium]|nr:MAG: ABC transporter ATP-binding protein [Acidobacteriota bacterium]